MWTKIFFLLVFHHLGLTNGAKCSRWSDEEVIYNSTIKAAMPLCKEKCLDDENCVFGVGLNRNINGSLRCRHGMNAADDKPPYAICTRVYHLEKDIKFTNCEYPKNLITPEHCRIQCDHLRPLGGCEFGYHFDIKDGGGKNCCIAQDIKFITSRTSELYRFTRVWLTFTDMQTPGGVAKPNIKELKVCKRKCDQSDKLCTNINWVENAELREPPISKCWLSRNDNRQSKISITNYKLFDYDERSEWDEVKNVKGKEYEAYPVHTMELCQQHCEIIMNYGGCGLGFHFDGSAKDGQMCGIRTSERETYQQNAILYRKRPPKKTSKRPKTTQEYILHDDDFAPKEDIGDEAVQPSPARILSLLTTLLVGPALVFF